MHDAIITWYTHHARELPWRSPTRTPWGVLVSEVMLQQTPVARVLPVWREWMARWPEPSSLAAAEPAAAIRAWGRLGYPRRALRLHAAAVAITSRHDGVVPAGYDDLTALPGIGDYTAAAVAVFAYGRRHPVLDTNVRRVFARTMDGRQFATTSPTAAERSRAEQLLPADPQIAATWSVAVMELGALVCTSRAPHCRVCPVSGTCAWRSAGSPAHAGPPRRGQPWEGTDRQARGRIMAVMRAAEGPVAAAALEVSWPDPAQRTRALDSLVADGLVEALGDDRFQLPAGEPPAAGRR